jgi:hypothetical protein
LYDALDFSTDCDDGGGQTRESLSRIASASAAAARLDPGRPKRTSRFVIIVSLAGFDRVKAEGFAPDMPTKFARIGSVWSGLDDGHLLLTGTAGVKFGNDTRTLSWTR